MNAFDSCKLYRFNTGSQIFETVIYRNGCVNWLSLPSKDIYGKSLNGNRREVYRSLRSDFPNLNFVSAEQIHSNTVSKVSSQSEFEKKQKCDGLITTETNTALIIRTADCLPVFIFNQSSIAILHAGHKGIYSNILKKWDQHNYNESSQLIVGDHIRSCCFKVHKDLEQRFRKLSTVNHRDIVKVNRDQWSISLVNILFNQWNRLERSSEDFFDFSNCSCCNENIYSYRRSAKSLEERTGHIIFRTEA